VELEAGGPSAPVDQAAAPASAACQEADGPLGLATREERVELARRLRQRWEKPGAPAPAPPAAPDPAARAETEWNATLARLEAIAARMPASTH
jgi:hypothetical protein